MVAIIHKYFRQFNKRILLYHNSPARQKMQTNNGERLNISTHLFEFTFIGLNMREINNYKYNLSK